MAEGYRSRVTVERDAITINGLDLTDQLLGRSTFADMVALVLLDREPGAVSQRMVDALLMVLVEHGFTGSAISSRLVYSYAPEAIQGAVSSGLLSAGSKHLGTSEDCARMLQDAMRRSPGQEVDDIAKHVVDDAVTRRGRLPGVGHAVHGDGDPRAARLFEIAREESCFGPHCDLLRAIGQQLSEVKGRPFPVNVTGAIGAIGSDLGLRWELAKSFALIGRTLGLLGHVRDELEQPIADDITRLVGREFA